ncbi:MAG: enoyl-CoA hydratase/isomerase family protein, partial [Acidimicrobiales bacterium]
GAGDRAFCAGADLATAATGAAGGSEDLGRLLLDLWSLGKPTVARVRGYALAGGFGLAAACDLVVASDDAVFATPEIDVGLWPFVASVALVRAMPPKVALELMMTGRRVGAEEGVRLGFVHRMVTVEALDAAVDEVAATLAAKPPGAMGRGRDAFHATWGMGAAEALEHLHPLLTGSLATDEAAEGRAAFAEKRPPRWPGG